MDAKELDKIDTDCTLKQGYRQAPEAGVADTLQKIRDIIQSIAEEAIKLGEWDDFTSADLKGIVGCLFYWICDPNVISPKDSAAGLCWQWICHKKGIKLSKFFILRNFPHTRTLAVRVFCFMIVKF